MTTPLQNVKFVQKILRFFVATIPSAIRMSHVSSTFFEATYEFGAIEFTLDYIFEQEERTIKCNSESRKVFNRLSFTRTASPTTLIIVPSILIKCCNTLIRKGVCYTLMNCIIEALLRNNGQQISSSSLGSGSSPGGGGDATKRTNIIKKFFQYENDATNLLTQAVLCNNKNLDRSIRFVIEQAHRFSVLRKVLDAKTNGIITTTRTPLLGLIEVNNKSDITSAVKLLVDAGTQIKPFENELLVACLKNRYDLDVAKVLLNHTVTVDASTSTSSPRSDEGDDAAKNSNNNKINVKAVVAGQNLLSALAIQGKLKALELLINKAKEDNQILNFEQVDAFGLTVVHTCLCCGARSSAILRLLASENVNLNMKTQGQVEKKKESNNNTSSTDTLTNNNNDKSEKWFLYSLPAGQKKSSIVQKLPVRLSLLGSEVAIPAGVAAFHIVAHSSLTSQSATARIEIMKTLLELGANPNEKDGSGDLPLDYSRLSNDSPEVIRFLESVTKK